MNEYICISMSRYDEMLRAETERDILLRAYQDSPTYAVQAVADAVFGQDQKYRPDDRDTDLG